MRTPYWTKKGHLGMTRQQLLEKINNGGGSKHTHVLTYEETIGSNTYDFQAHLLLDTADPITGADLAQILFDAGFTSNTKYFMVYSKQKIKTAATNKIALSTDDQIWSADGSSIVLMHTVNRIEYTGSGITSDVGSSTVAGITLSKITDKVID